MVAAIRVGLTNGITIIVNSNVEYNSFTLHLLLSSQHRAFLIVDNGGEIPELTPFCNRMMHLDSNIWAVLHTGNGQRGFCTSIRTAINEFCNVVVVILPAGCSRCRTGNFYAIRICYLDGCATVGALANENLNKAVYIYGHFHICKTVFTVIITADSCKSIGVVGCYAKSLTFVVNSNTKLNGSALYLLLRGKQRTFLVIDNSLEVLEFIIIRSLIASVENSSQRESSKQHNEHAEK